MKSRWSKRTVDVLFYVGATKERVEEAIRDAYIAGLKSGYDMAVSDFFSASRPNGDYDENWFTTTPSLHRSLGGYARMGKEALTENGEKRSGGAVMPYIETVDDLADILADRLGIYEDRRCQRNDSADITHVEHCSCRVNWVPAMADRMRQAVKNERILEERR